MPPVVTSRRRFSIALLAALAGSTAVLVLLVGGATAAPSRSPDQSKATQSVTPSHGSHAMAGRSMITSSTPATASSKTRASKQVHRAGWKSRHGLAAGGARSSGSAAAHRAEAGKVSPIGPASAGMVIARDPVTGEITSPTPEQLKALGLEPKAASANPYAGLPIVRQRNGGEGMDVRGRLMEYVVVRKDAAGKVRMDCVPSEKDAKKVMQSNPAAPTAPVEE